MDIALITAGGAGMFCGSCMHDNTLACALIGEGHAVHLIPTYTPIRVDEQNVSTGRVFLGGLNVYLDEFLPLWRKLPRGLVRWLDSPGLIRLVARLAVSADARKLGKLTVDLLQGSQGPQAREIDELATFIGRELRPDVVCFSNALLAGVLPRLRELYSGRIDCLLQGDDIFLDELREPFREESLSLLRRHVQLFDTFLVHSAYYRDFMAGYLALPPEKMRIVPLGIDLAGHDGVPRPNSGDPLTIGYFARICPEKGLHLLIDAFRIVHQAHPHTRLVAGGYLGKRDEPYFQRLARGAADLGTTFSYIGSPAGHEEKVTFLKTLDVLSVPTTYREPKGLYILEALANGVPVVQPRHGAFPEIIEATGGGILVQPLDAADLARGLVELIADSKRRLELARNGQAAVRSNFDARTMALATLDIWSRR